MPTSRRPPARFANVLVALGVEPGDRVAVQADKSIEALMLYLGTVRAGGVFLPLNTAYTPTEIDYFLNDAKPRVFVCDPAKRDGLAATAEGAGARLETLGARAGGRRQPERAGRSGLRRIRHGRAPAGRPCRDPLHVGHDRPLQGRHADPGQSPVQRRSAARRTGASPPTTCCCTFCRSSTPTACSSRPTPR